MFLGSFLLFGGVFGVGGCGWIIDLWCGGSFSVVFGLFVPQCAKCVEGFCSVGGWEEGQLPGFCPMRFKGGVIDAAVGGYGGDGGLYLNSTGVEQRAYGVVGVRPRVLGIIRLSEMMSSPQKNIE